MEGAIQIKFIISIIIIGDPVPDLERHQTIKEIVYPLLSIVKSSATLGRWSAETGPKHYIRGM